ncbi:hypothetical protein R1flu_025454 [Riccia fluitans]|uniref:Uncharacterized protein n=1 Tax=Riccia fluitans TaxID=41844 RepID=A0ABD1XXS8_9MARC
MTKLEDFKRSVTAKEKAAEETHLQKLALVQTQLEEYKRSSEASITRLEEEASCLREALAAKESAVQALENAHQKEISTLKTTCRKYKISLDGEIGTNATLQARVLNLRDELNTCEMLVNICEMLVNTRRNKRCRAKSQPGLNYSRSRRNYGCCKSFTRRLMKAMQQAPLENVKI